MENELGQTSQEIMANTLGGEMDRYWTRFNIFAAVQVGAVIGVVSSLAILLANPGIFRFVLLFLLWFSITGSIAVLRGHDLQRSIVLAMAELEQSLPEGQRLLALTRKHFRLPTFISNYACSTFAIFCCVCWAADWLWLECNGYSGIVVPKP